MGEAVSSSVKEVSRVGIGEMGEKVKDAVDVASDWVVE